MQGQVASSGPSAFSFSSLASSLTTPTISDGMRANECDPYALMEQGHYVSTGVANAGRAELAPPEARVVRNLGAGAAGALYCD